MKNSKFKKILSIILAFIVVFGTIPTSILPVSAADNADGSGGSSGSNTTNGWYRTVDGLWKVSVYVAKNSEYNAETSGNAHSTKQGDGEHWYKYGKTIFVADSDVSTLKGNLSNSWFVAENKIELLRKGSDPSKIGMSMQGYDKVDGRILWLSSSPTLPINNMNTVQNVKTWFANAGNFQRILKKIASVSGGKAYDQTYSVADYLEPIKNYNFTIDGVTRKAVDDTSGWMNTSGNARYKDYNKKAITIYPFSGSAQNKSAVDWLVVYEPVIVLHVRGGCNGKSCVALTPTEISVIASLEDTQNHICDLVGLYPSYKNVFPNAVYLEKSWLGYPAGQKFTTSSSLTSIFLQSGWGMKHTSSGVASAPDNVNELFDLGITVKTDKKVAKSGQTITVTYTVTNNTTTVKSVPIYLFALYNGKYYSLGTDDSNNTRSVTLKSDNYKASTESAIYPIIYNPQNIVCRVNGKQSATYTFKVKLDASIDATKDVSFIGRVNWSQRSTEENPNNNTATTTVKRLDDAKVYPTIKVNLKDKTGTESVQGKKFAVFIYEVGYTSGGTARKKTYAPVNGANQGFIGVITTDANGVGTLDLTDEGKNTISKYTSTTGWTTANGTTDMTVWGNTWNNNVLTYSTGSAYNAVATNATITNRVFGPFFGSNITKYQTLEQQYGAILHNDGTYKGSSSNRSYIKMVVRPVSELTTPNASYYKVNTKLEVYGHRDANGNYLANQTAISSGNLAQDDTHLYNTTNNKTVYNDSWTLTFTQGGEMFKEATFTIEPPRSNVTVNVVKGDGYRNAPLTGQEFCLTDSNGYKHYRTVGSSQSVTFTNIPVGDYKVFPCLHGDVNMDNQINTEDIMLISSEFDGEGNLKNVLKGKARTYADLNCDGKLTASTEDANSDFGIMMLYYISTGFVDISGDGLIDDFDAFLVENTWDNPTCDNYIAIGNVVTSLIDTKDKTATINAVTNKYEGSANLDIALGIAKGIFNNECLFTGDKGFTMSQTEQSYYNNYCTYLAYSKYDSDDIFYSFYDKMSAPTAREAYLDLHATQRYDTFYFGRSKHEGQIYPGSVYSYNHYYEPRNTSGTTIYRYTSGTRTVEDDYPIYTSLYSEVLPSGVTVSHDFPVCSRYNKIAVPTVKINVVDDTEGLGGPISLGYHVFDIFLMRADAAGNIYTYYPAENKSGYYSYVGVATTNMQGVASYEFEDENAFTKDMRDAGFDTYQKDYFYGNLLLPQSDGFPLIRNDGTSGVIPPNKMYLFIRPKTNIEAQGYYYSYGNETVPIYTDEIKSIYETIGTNYDYSTSGNEVRGIYSKSGELLYKDIVEVRFDSTEIAGNQDALTQEVTIHIKNKPGTVNVELKRGNQCTLTDFQNKTFVLVDRYGEYHESSTTLKDVNTGFASFNEIPAGDYRIVPFLLGDVNFDGKYTTEDYEVATNHIGNTSFDGTHENFSVDMRVCDVDKNGTITNEDIELIKGLVDGTCKVKYKDNVNPVEVSDVYSRDHIFTPYYKNGYEIYKNDSSTVKTARIDNVLKAGANQTETFYLSGSNELVIRVNLLRDVQCWAGDYKNQTVNLYSSKDNYTTPIQTNRTDENGVVDFTVPMDDEGVTYLAYPANTCDCHYWNPAKSDEGNKISYDELSDNLPNITTRTYTLQNNCTGSFTLIVKNDDGASSGLTTYNTNIYLYGVTSDNKETLLMTLKDEDVTANGITATVDRNVAKYIRTINFSNIDISGDCQYVSYKVKVDNYNLLGDTYTAVLVSGPTDIPIPIEKFRECIAHNNGVGGNHPLGVYTMEFTRPSSLKVQITAAPFLGSYFNANLASKSTSFKLASTSGLNKSVNEKSSYTFSNLPRENNKNSKYYLLDFEPVVTLDKLTYDSITYPYYYLTKSYSGDGDYYDEDGHLYKITLPQDSSGTAKVVLGAVGTIELTLEKDKETAWLGSLNEIPVQLLQDGKVIRTLETDENGFVRFDCVDISSNYNYKLKVVDELCHETEDIFVSTTELKKAYNDNYVISKKAVVKGHTAGIEVSFIGADGTINTIPDEVLTVITQNAKISFTDKNGDHQINEILSKNGTFSYNFTIGEHQAGNVYDFDISGLESLSIGDYEIIQLQGRPQLTIEDFRVHETGAFEHVEKYVFRVLHKTPGNITVAVEKDETLHSNDQKSHTITLFDESGNVVETRENVPFGGIADFHNLPRGNYYAQIEGVNYPDTNEDGVIGIEYPYETDNVISFTIDENINGEKIGTFVISANYTPIIQYELGESALCDESVLNEIEFTLNNNLETIYKTNENGTWAGSTQKAVTALDTITVFENHTLSKFKSITVDNFKDAYENGYKVERKIFINGGSGEIKVVFKESDKVWLEDYEYTLYVTSEKVNSKDELSKDNLVDTYTFTREIVNGITPRYMKTHIDCSTTAAVQEYHFYIQKESTTFEVCDCHSWSEIAVVTVEELRNATNNTVTRQTELDTDCVGQIDVSVSDPYETGLDIANREFYVEYYAYDENNNLIYAPDNYFSETADGNKRYAIGTNGKYYLKNATGIAQGTHVLIANVNTEKGYIVSVPNGYYYKDVVKTDENGNINISNLRINSLPDVVETLEFTFEKRITGTYTPETMSYIKKDTVRWEYVVTPVESSIDTDISLVHTTDGWYPSGDNSFTTDTLILRDECVHDKNGIHTTSANFILFIEGTGTLEYEVKRDQNTFLPDDEYMPISYISIISNSGDIVYESDNAKYGEKITIDVPYGSYYVDYEIQEFGDIDSEGVYYSNEELSVHTTDITPKSPNGQLNTTVSAGWILNLSFDLDNLNACYWPDESQKEDETAWYNQEEKEIDVIFNGNSDNIYTTESDNCYPYLYKMQKEYITSLDILSQLPTGFEYVFELNSDDYYNATTSEFIPVTRDEILENESYWIDRYVFISPISSYEVSYTLKRDEDTVHFDDNALFDVYLCNYDRCDTYNGVAGPFKMRFGDSVTTKLPYGNIASEIYLINNGVADDFIIDDGNRYYYTDFQYHWIDETTKNISEELSAYWYVETSFVDDNQPTSDIQFTYTQSSHGDITEITNEEGKCTSLVSSPLTKIAINDPYSRNWSNFVPATASEFKDAWQNKYTIIRNFVIEEETMGDLTVTLNAGDRVHPDDNALFTVEVTGPNGFSETIKNFGFGDTKTFANVLTGTYTAKIVDVNNPYVDETENYSATVVEDGNNEISLVVNVNYTAIIDYDKTEEAWINNTSLSGIGFYFNADKTMDAVTGENGLAAITTTKALTSITSVENIECHFALDNNFEEITEADFRNAYKSGYVVTRKMFIDTTCAGKMSIKVMNANKDLGISKYIFFTLYGIDANGNKTVIQEKIKGTTEDNRTANYVIENIDISGNTNYVSYQIIPNVTTYEFDGTQCYLILNHLPEMLDLLESGSSFTVADLRLSHTHGSNVCGLHTATQEDEAGNKIEDEIVYVVDEAGKVKVNIEVSDYLNGFVDVNTVKNASTFTVGTVKHENADFGKALSLEENTHKVSLDLGSLIASNYFIEDVKVVTETKNSSTINSDKTVDVDVVKNGSTEITYTIGAKGKINLTLKKGSDALFDPPANTQVEVKLNGVETDYSPVTIEKLGSTSSIPNIDLSKEGTYSFEVITEATTPNYWEEIADVTVTQMKEASNAKFTANRDVIYSSLYYDYSIVINPATITVKTGETFTFTVTVTDKKGNGSTTQPTLELYWNNTIIDDPISVEFDEATGTATYTFTTKAPPTEGTHTITGYVNREGKYYEVNMDDNIATAQVVIPPDEEFEDLYLNYVPLNADLRKGEETVVSFIAHNTGSIDVLKEHNVALEAELVYKETYNGEWKRMPIGDNADDLKTVVIPSVEKGGENLIYVRFTVPENIYSVQHINAKLNMNADSEWAEENLTNNTARIPLYSLFYPGDSSNPGYMEKALSAPNGYVSEIDTPNLTEYNKYSGVEIDGFTITKTVGNKAQWSIWEEQSDKELIAYTYDATVSATSIVKVDNRCLTSKQVNSTVSMKSGYAVTLAVLPRVTSNTNGGKHSLQLAVTDCQLATAYFPEVSYNKNEYGKYSILDRIDTASEFNTSQFTSANTSNVGTKTHDFPILGNAPRWELPLNTKSNFTAFLQEENASIATQMTRKHFTPLWWKDGAKYEIKTEVGRVWTPSGVMANGDIAKARLTTGTSSSPVDLIINGSVYDDYYTVR